MPWQVMTRGSLNFWFSCTGVKPVERKSPIAKVSVNIQFDKKFRPPPIRSSRVNELSCKQLASFFVQSIPKGEEVWGFNERFHFVSWPCLPFLLSFLYHNLRVGWQQENMMNLHAVSSFCFVRYFVFLWWRRSRSNKDMWKRGGSQRWHGMEGHLKQQKESIVWFLIPWLEVETRYSLFIAMLRTSFQSEEREE